TSIDEEPAYDAPRAVSKDASQIDGASNASKSPLAQQGTEAPRSSADSAKGADESNPAAPRSDEANAEAIPSVDSDRGASDQPEKRENVEPQPDPKPPAQPEKLATTDGDRFPTFESVPDAAFEALAKAAPVGGGNAKTTYLTTLYGMIVPLMH